MSDIQTLAKKVLSYLGKSPEDALMTFAEDGSTHGELLELARKVQDSAQLTIEKALQIETDPTGKHRCINCGQLKPESELYRGEADWACVDQMARSNRINYAPSESQLAWLRDIVARVNERGC
jgi:hypothetical protein